LTTAAEKAFLYPEKMISRARDILCPSCPSSEQEVNPMSRKPKAAIRALIGIPMVVLALSAGSSAADISSQRLIDASGEPENWLTYGGTYNAWRYSPLDQINQSNVTDLVPKWVFQTGMSNGGFSCTPLVADGVM
jgi:alcohol dehydrogenase (cytochrome c)